VINIKFYSDKTVALWQIILACAIIAKFSSIFHDTIIMFLPFAY